MSKQMHMPDIENHGLFADPDVACAVCHLEPAVMDCQTGVFSPCWKCQEKGWHILKLPKFVKRFIERQP